jgi:predicted HicB family RNase H-like nuclease
MPRPAVDRTGQRQIHVWLKEDTHKKIRVRVAEQDTSLQDWAEQALEAYLKSQPKTGVKR